MFNFKLKVSVLLFVFTSFFWICFASLVWAETGFTIATNTEEQATSTSLADLLIPDPVTIHLQIEASTSTLYSGEISVSACSASSSSVPTVNAYCAIRQTGLESDWSLYGEDQFLNSLGGFNNDYSANLYWNWFSNFEYGQTSLSQHLLIPEEKLLLSFERQPLKIEVSTTTPYFEDILPVKVLAFGFDSSWNGIWSPSASSTIRSEAETYFTDEQGDYDLLISTTSPFTISASREGFLASPSLDIFPLSIGTSSATTTDLNMGTTTATTTEEIAEGNNSSGSHSPDSLKEFSLEEAYEFIWNQQRGDGSFGSSLYTDWVAIALSLNESDYDLSNLISYLKNDNSSLNSITDYERRAMALMSLNINPYDDTEINYIQKILDSFDGQQIGDDSLVNDDIFAIFPLLKAGYDEEDDIVAKILEFIISKQNSDGSWDGGVDLTAGAIQALNLTPSFPGVGEALASGREYLRVHQSADGGFGSGFSTSWVIQAISALGENPTNWKKNGNSPLDFLANLQQSDGGVESVEQSRNTRLWSTAYAIPAILQKPWGDILSVFSKKTFSDKNKQENNLEETISLPINDDLASSTTVALVTGDEDLDIFALLSVLNSLDSSNTIGTESSISNEETDISESDNLEEGEIIELDEEKYLPVATVGLVQSKLFSDYAIILGLSSFCLLVLSFVLKFKNK